MQCAAPDLGARLTAALEWALEHGAHRVRGRASLRDSGAAAPAQLSQACVVGTDIPELSQQVLDRAMCLLEEHEARCRLPVRPGGRCLPDTAGWPQVVLGPSADGGFYLVAVSRLVPGMMQACVPASVPGCATRRC